MNYMEKLVRWVQVLLAFSAERRTELAVTEIECVVRLDFISMNVLLLKIIHTLTRLSRNRNGKKSTQFTWRFTRKILCIYTSAQ